MTSNYQVRVVDVCGLSFSSMRMHDFYRGEIIRVGTGEVAYRTKDYSEARTARLQASRFVKNFEHHLAKHGIGFEEQEAAKKADLRKRREAAKKARRETQTKAPDLLAALRAVAPDHPLAAELSWPDIPTT